MYQHLLGVSFQISFTLTNNICLGYCIQFCEAKFEILNMSIVYKFNLSSLKIVSTSIKQDIKYKKKGIVHNPCTLQNSTSALCGLVGNLIINL